MKKTHTFRRMRRGGKSRGASALGKLIPQSLNWGSLFFGLLLGIFVTSLMVFTFSTSDITLRIPTSSTKKAHTVAKKSDPNENSPATVLAANEPTLTTAEPRFDFYTELTKPTPEPQPVIAQKTPPISNSASKPATLDLKNRPKTINGYLVQAGHFRKSAQADALKAKLVLNGFEAKIVASKERNGETWHRIFLGPVKTEQNAKDLQKQLKGLNIDSILVLKYNN